MGSPVPLFQTRLANGANIPARLNRSSSMRSLRTAAF
jgi:hypothetical protein